MIPTPGPPGVYPPPGLTTIMLSTEPSLTIGFKVAPVPRFVLSTKTAVVLGV